MGARTNGVENFGGLFNTGCTTIYDQIAGVQAFDTLQHTWPTGLPMSGISMTAAGGAITVFIYGCLISATSLP